MIRTASSVRILQAVAVIAGLAVLLWSLGLPSLRFADAANLTTVSDTLTDTATSTPANHTLVFTTPTGVAAGESIVVTFEASSFNPSALDFNDFDLATSTGDITLVDTGLESGQSWGVTTDATSITFTSASGVIPANATVTIEMGTNATFQTTGDTQIVNPASTGSYEINIDAGTQDSGATRVVILSNVLVTASVDTTFTFNVAGVGSGTVNGEAITGASTATAIPFGTLASGTATTTAQDLSVTTNASQGFSVTVQTDGYLMSSTGAVIDPFEDSNTPTTWTFPVASVNDPTTWGHWGITSEDTSTNRGGGAGEFGADEWIGATTTGRTVMYHDGPADGATAHVGATRVGFQVEITPLQEAGDDYSAVLTYVATPVF